MNIWTVAPAAYQNGPDTPYSYATVLAWRSVAAHVQADTTPQAMRPGLILRLAVLNSSLALVEYLVYLFCAQEIPSMTTVKKPPMPTTTPYPAPWGRIGATVVELIVDDCNGWQCNVNNKRSRELKAMKGKDESTFLQTSLKYLR